jgi:hypothetical protein
MQYRVEILFKKGPSFEIDVFADTEDEARASGKTAAKQYGFEGQVKRVNVSEMQ